MTIFVKKSLFFGAKFFFDSNFFVEITKNSKKLLYQMKVGMFIGKVKKFGIGWCIPHRMAADNAEGGFVQPPPLHLIGLIQSGLNSIMLFTFIQMLGQFR